MCMFHVRLLGCLSLAAHGASASVNENGNAQCTIDIGNSPAARCGLWEFGLRCWVSTRAGFGWRDVRNMGIWNMGAFFVALTGTTGRLGLVLFLYPTAPA